MAAGFRVVMSDASDDEDDAILYPATATSSRFDRATRSDDERHSTTVVHPSGWSRPA